MAFDKNFDDIEMLDIPDDILESSTTEGISDSSSSASKSHTKFDNALFTSQKVYLELQEWLNTSLPIEFHFDTEEYKRSLKTKNDFLSTYINYVTTLYKVIESLSSDNVNRIGMEYQEEQIGLISRSTGASADRLNRLRKVDGAFADLVENLKQLLTDLQQQQDIDENDEAQEYQLEKLHTLLYILECLQANVFYLDVRQKPTLISTWVNRFDPKPDNELVEQIMIQTPKPYLHPEFWNTYLNLLITRGLLDAANEALTHCKYQELEQSSPELYSIIADFQSLVSTYTNFALKGHFPEWKLSACEFRDAFAKTKGSITDSTNQIIANQLYNLTSIITGLPKTISSFCDSWFEVYNALSLYQIRDSEEIYSELFKVAIDEKPPAIFSDSDDFGQVAEQCFLDILEENFLKVLKTLHELDPATAAFVSKLLELKGSLNSYYSVNIDTRELASIVNKRTISEYFLVIHAYGCLNIHDLVPVGIGLLLNDDISISKESIANNHKVIAKFLPKFQCQTNDDLEWGLTICAKLNFISTARELYYLYGLKSLDDGFIYEALNMFVNCYDPTVVSEDNNNDGMKQVHHIVWELIFQDSLINNRPVQDELINNIINNQVDENFDIHPVIRQCLSPYAVLYQFFKSLENPSFAISGKVSKLIHLLRFNHLPKKFYPLLLSQFLPFLVNAKYNFQLPDLIVIIELIDLYETQGTGEELKEGDQLYKYAINHVEEEVTDYDWRELLKENGVTVPGTVKELTKTLRNEIVAKVGQVYIQ